MTKITRKRNKLGQFTKASPWESFAFIKFIKRKKKTVYYGRPTVFFKATSALMIILLLVGFLGIRETRSYYNDSETSNDNSFSATMFDVLLTDTSINDALGPGLTDEIDFDTLLLKVGGSLKPQYKVSAELIAGSNLAFCNAITLTATRAGFLYDGPLLDFTAGTTTALGTWEFDLELDKEQSDFPHGAMCNVDIRFDAWRDGINTPEESGYTDTERVEIRLDAHMVVLNEFLPYPNGSAYGFDFGDDNSDMPQGEWVELYNNSDFPADLSGWYIWDNSGLLANQIPVTVTNTQPATMTIPAHDWLVVYMNDAILDNTGDTVQLFDNTNGLIDSYTYNSHDVCELEPTPTDPNDTTVGVGTCSSIPSNKSYARIPDGVGSWVDPIPTPGTSNELADEIIPEEVIVTPEPILEENISTGGNGATAPSIEADEPPASPEEVVETTEDIVPEVIAEIPQALEPEEIITEESEVVETPISEVVEPVVEEEVVEVVPEEIVIEEPTVVEVVEEVPAVEPAVVSE